MRLWLRFAVRHWSRHRFITLMLALGYAVGITLATVVFAAINSAAQIQKALSYGDPDRSLYVSISAMEELPFRPEEWFQDLPVAWGWAYLGEAGERLAASLGPSHIVALFGSGEVSWSPPLRLGRFLTREDLQGTRRVLVKGEQTGSPPPGFEVVGVAYDREVLEGNRWKRAVFLPVRLLPESLRERAGLQLVLYLELVPGADLTLAQQRLMQNLRQSLPTANVSIETQ